MTMAVFDYSDIKARMERRKPVTTTSFANGGHFQVSAGETVNITVRQGVDVERFVRPLCSEIVWASPLFE